MNTRTFLLPIFLCALWCGPCVAAEWEPLFNGRDLSGWVPVNVAPKTFTVRDGIIVSTGKPTGVLRTEKQYENFEMELDWKHIVPGGNAGLFVWSDPVTALGEPFTRAIEVQVLDGQQTENYTSDGDVFSIHGAHFTPDRPHPAGWERCLPSERRSKPAGEWNHYHVVCNNGDIKLAVNGKVVSGGSHTTPRKGYVCLESEGSECHFKNIRIKELPSTNPRPAEIAPLAQGFISIYTGLNLDGWKHTPDHEQHWKPNDWILECDGKSDPQDGYLWTEKSYRNFVMICDWRQKQKPQDNDQTLPISVRGADPALKTAPKIGQWNRFIITVQGDQLTLQLNGKTVLENSPLTGTLARGPIGLHHHGSAVEFANLYVKELP
jgi:hypothetical protein